MEMQELRNRIDELNRSILDLFLERMQVSEKIAEEKMRLGIPLTDPARERAILAEMQELAGPEMEACVWQLFTRLMALSRAHQSVLMPPSGTLHGQLEAMLAQEESFFPGSGTVACQGVEGSNAQAACDKLIPRGQIIYVRSFRAVFDAVESGLCRFGVLPIENSSNGSVRAVYELLQEKHCRIVRSTSMHIRHELLAKPGTRLEDIRAIYSHEQALGQCSRYLSSLRDVKLIPCENTAVAARQVSLSDDPGLAAVASPRCRELYGLHALRSDIQDTDNNYTRFICIAREPVVYAGANRTCLILRCDDRPGALCDALSILAVRGVNMSKLESCPDRAGGDGFLFFLELGSGLRDPRMLPMLTELEGACAGLSFLGSYAAV